jgi:hypothetical protein
MVRDGARHARVLYLQVYLGLEELGTVLMSVSACHEGTVELVFDTVSHGLDHSSAAIALVCPRRCLVVGGVGRKAPAGETVPTEGTEGARLRVSTLEDRPNRTPELVLTTINLPHASFGPSK